MWPAGGHLGRAEEQSHSLFHLGRRQFQLCALQSSGGEPPYFLNTQHTRVFNKEPGLSLPSEHLQLSSENSCTSSELCEVIRLYYTCLCLWVHTVTRLVFACCVLVDVVCTPFKRHLHLIDVLLPHRSSSVLARLCPGNRKRSTPTLGSFMPLTPCCASLCVGFGYPISECPPCHKYPFL